MRWWAEMRRGRGRPPAEAKTRCNEGRRRIECGGLWCKWSSRANAPFYAVQTTSPKHRVPDCRRSSALNGQTPQSELSLADAMHQLDARNRDRRIPEPLESEHHSNALLHAPMVLLDQVVQYFDERSFVLAGSVGEMQRSRIALGAQPEVDR